ncbi:hypothetical protein DENSPDRAFT_817793 [Dentipellis sp. KUC8613]|nr:hypothetical protein DENSPDRAFT_817793 [Dentipellis sp. KUC8613]
MSSRNIAGGHALPSNPQWLEFERSDGDESLWPTNTECVVDHEGQVNYMRPVDDDESSSVHWRTQIAKKVAEKLGMAPNSSYVLKSWPQGYHMYDHNKGKKSAPRHDLYLIGSVNAKRFRSIPEFVPHAIWLMQDPTLDRSNCECKYCAKKPQRLISEGLGFKPHTSTSGSTPLPSRRPPREGRGRVPREQREPRPYATVRRAPKAAKQLVGPQQIMVHERCDDLQAVYSELDTSLRRWFREGEVVWCALVPPIKGPDETITFWPGLVQDTQVKAEAIPRDPLASTHSADGDYEMEDGTMPHQAGASTNAAEGSSSQAPPAESAPAATRGDSPVPWTIRQKTLYKVKLLGINQQYIAADDHVLPYQGYTPSQALLRAMQASFASKGIPSPEEMASFNPCPDDVDDSTPAAHVRFADAVAPYSVAIQIAAGVVGYWTPTDEWEFKMTVPTPGNSSAVGTPAVAPPTLQAAILAAQQAAADGPSHGVTGVRDMTALELQALGEKLLGAVPTVPIFTQTRYQGLWWGAERIWTDELVRLKVARRQIAPDGAQNIYPASGPSRATIEELGQVEGGESVASLGALDRGVFMKLEALFVVDVPNVDGAGTTKECRASGMLYELADEGWEEPAHEPVVNGKGKEPAGPAPQDALTAAGLTSPPRPSQGEKTNGPVELQTGAPFMSGPSPLKPPPLPNPDPSVPLQDTAASVLSASLSQAQGDGASTSAPVPPPSTPPRSNGVSNDAAPLSSPPTSTGYPLPPAPRGFKFRPILPPGHEVVVSLTLLSGRYYPQLLAHPLLRPIVRSLGASESVGDQHLLALEGLYPGFFNAVDPVRWKPSRSAMVRDADADGRREMEKMWEVWRAAGQGGAMEVDAQGGPSAGPSAPMVGVSS